MANKPHGGELINRVLSEKEKNKIIKNWKKQPKLEITFDDFLELRNLGEGVFSPLQGFMTEDEFNSVIMNYRLKNRLCWTIPITLNTDEKTASKYETGEDVILVNDSKPVGILHLEDKFKPNKKEWCMSVYGTIDKKHPGVNNILNEGEVALGGRIDYFNNIHPGNHRLTPMEARELFHQKGWNTIAAFQTRNAPHRAHEYLQKTALEVVDGLLVHPLIGRKKAGDYKNEVIMKSYDLLIKNYFPGNSMVFGILTTSMHYAGPVEAIHHAIMRKNYGCTHFIVGRDHAGVGNYYPTFAAHDIFNDFKELNITPIKFENAFYCKECKSLATGKTCPHSNENHIIFSGTKIRKMLNNGEKIPNSIMRKEIYNYLNSTKDLYVK